MQINANLDNLSANDTIVLANNRQVIAFKRTWKFQRGYSRLPKIFSWKKYLHYCWEVEKYTSSCRCISDMESRYLITKSIDSFGRPADTKLLDEVVKNNDYCCAYNVSLSKLSNYKSDVHELFSNWVNYYRNMKKELNLVDVNDLPSLIINSTNKFPSIHIYGFKTLTPVQLSIFSYLGYQTINPVKSEINISTKVFNNTNDEIRRAAVWAKSVHESSPSKSIVIVSPQLNEIHYQLSSTFDQEFNNLITETGNKSYNISLGLALTQYPLIQNILYILELSNQLQTNKINSSAFISVVSSVYITEHTNERSARILLVNKILSLAADEFSLDRVENYLSACPKLHSIISLVSQMKRSDTTLDVHLEQFNKVLQLWGFATNRTLSSVEYQLFNKYLETSLGLNKISQLDIKVSTKDAISELRNILSNVIFQAQSSKTQIQVLGALEADGLHFDYAWVMGITNNFLPAKLNSPRFIPFSISSEHQIPNSNYELIAEDGENTISNLKSIAREVIFSYAKIHRDEEQLPSPLIKFDKSVEIGVDHNTTLLDMNSTEDSITTRIENTQINSGIKTLKDQISCPFKGFVNRLNIETFDLQHIGIDKREQGKIIHRALQYIYEDISSQEQLLQISNADLNQLIDSKINAAIACFSNSGFKKIEKIRAKKVILKFIEEDKIRDGFKVVSTEQSVEVSIAGLSFITRLDRLDEMQNGDKIVFDYKTGKTSISNWCAETIKDPQLPVYAITNKTEGAAFIELSARKISFKGISKDKNSLPPQSNRKSSCIEWGDQVDVWQYKLDTASTDFQHGVANVSPKKGACEYCENDPLCRVDK